MDTMTRTPLFVPGSALASSAKRGMELVDLMKMGIMPISVVGAEGGYNAGQDILTQTADGFDLNNVWDEFQSAVALLNQQRQAIVDFLTFSVTNPTERVPQISSASFEKSSEYGEPRGIRPTGSFFTLGYDMDWYDLAARFTWRFLADAPVSQVEAINAMAIEADNRLVYGKVMDALYNPANRLADINGQDVNVYALYNADGTIPPKYKTNTFDGTHTHYLVSGATQVDPGDLDDLYEHMRHHGYSLENGVSHFLMVNPAQGKAIRQFKVTGGATFDFVPSTGQPAQFLPADIALFNGTQPAPTIAGLNVIGRYGAFLVIEDDMFPIGYVSAVGTGGRSNLQNPIGIREHINPQLRGLRLVKGPNPDYPLIDSFYNRGFGTGIRHRGGAVVMQIKASGSYVKPTLDV